MTEQQLNKHIIKEYLQTQLQTPQPKTKNTYWKRKIIHQLIEELTCTTK